MKTLTKQQMNMADGGFLPFVIAGICGLTGGFAIATFQGEQNALTGEYQTGSELYNNGYDTSSYVRSLRYQ